MTYIEWLKSYVGGIDRYSKLFEKLYSTEFIWSVNNDGNRAADGLCLRHEYKLIFRNERDFECTEVPYVTVLEVLVALSRRLEEYIMRDPVCGDRTGLWFWTMIDNLGLTPYDNNHFIESEVDYILSRFLHREYDPDGKGGLFTSGRGEDMRKIEIWYQAAWFLSDYLGY